MYENCDSFNSIQNGLLFGVIGLFLEECRTMVIQISPDQSRLVRPNPSVADDEVSVIPSKSDKSDRKGIMGIDC